MYESRGYGPQGSPQQALANGQSILDLGMPILSGGYDNPSGAGPLAVTGALGAGFLPADVGPRSGHPDPPQLDTYLLRS